ncbi:MAG: T9SS type A sorting domain-containing protein [Bacteroidia bacterium]
MRKGDKRILSVRLLCTILFLLMHISYQVNAQQLDQSNPSIKTFNANAAVDLFAQQGRFIENVGQFGEFYEGHMEMGRILYAYEGFNVPVLFTEKGLIYLHRKIKGPTLTEIEKEERRRKKKKKEEEALEYKAYDKCVTVQWENNTDQISVIGEGITAEYHTYGLSSAKARGFTKIVYRNVYTGVDVEYSFVEGKLNGYEYSLIVKPGADLSKIAMLFGGDLKKVYLDASSNLILRTSSGETKESAPVSFYQTETLDSIKENILSGFLLKDKRVSFHFPQQPDRSKTLIIDPFVTGTGNLTGTGGNNGLAKDVDFDYAGNAYVTGGGNDQIYKLAKFDASGVLQWTFSGTLTIPAWTFGTYYGGWVVDKNTGNVYLGQGFAPSGGHRIIRINTIGVYDNYISTANGSFLENWKMLWTCSSGSAQLMIAGGGTNSNINFGVLTPPATAVSSVNVTGIPYGTNGWAQDISDAIIDPSTNALYTIYGSLYGTPSLSNKIYKNNAPYSAASMVWNIASGYTTIMEIANRPYLLGPNIDNSSNVFAINSSYLFYWDGKNLKAFDKTTGATVGTPLTFFSNTALMCGGIIADECNNIFIGFTNGTIKVLSFSGGIFNDAAQPDITVPGFGASSVYDLSFYESQKTIYACGQGFVGAFDVSSYNCNAASFTIGVSASCGTLSATASISPLPPAGATVTYVLFNGTTQIASNTTGVFNGLTPNVTYTIKATINIACSGVITTTTFTLPGPAVTSALTAATCGNSDGTITVTAAGGTAPYTYSINGVTFQGSNVFTTLPAGIYTITVKDVNNCSNTQTVTIINSNGPALSYTKSDAICGSATGIITANATGGTIPYTFSINGTTFQTGNVFPGVSPGTYTLTVEDATGCRNATVVVVLNSPGPTASAVPATTFCNSANGSITVIATGGTAPLQYSLNANTYQLSNIFTALAGGTYTVTVKDANGCLSSVTATVGNSSGPTLTATAATASCGNANGSVTANSTGGVPPLQYSINGTTFQTSNFFGGLAPGSYTLSVKDANNCITTTTATVSSTGGPGVTATSGQSSCAGNTGTITAVGSGGTGALQYSINGTTYQASTLFSGLAPGTYIVYVKDVNGCLGGTQVTVTALAGPSQTLTTVSAGCNQSNGSITSTGISGTAPYTYSINGGTTYQASNVFSGLAVGTYSVIIKDVNGCTATSTINVNNISGLSLTLSNVSSACSVNNGSITANGQGGVAPLQYSLNGITWQSGNTFTGLGGGTYTVYVKDANACIITTTTTINVGSGPSITATATNATCAGNNGVIVASGSGGTAPLQYSINGSTYQSTGTFIGVAPGAYTVYVKDANNCIATTTVNITTSGSGPGITSFTVKTDGTYPCNSALGKITNPKVNGATCGSCTYSLNFGAFVPHATQLFLNLAAGTYYVTAKDVNGCTFTIQVVIGVATLSTANVVVTGTTCNGTTGSIALTGVGPKTPYHASITGMAGTWVTFDPTYTFTGLAPGTYTLLMADDESFDIGPPIIPGGCITTQTIIVPATNGPTISALSTPGSCGLSNGTISASGTGGSGALSYNLNGGAYQPSGIFTGLAAGTYSVTVMDGAGCINGTSVAVTNSGAATVSATTTPSACGSGSGTITVAANGGSAPLQYSINGTTFQSGNQFTNLAPGSYTVRVGDAGGCIVSTTVTVGSVAGPLVSAFGIAATCNTANGILIATGTSGVAPYQYSINGTTFQSSNQFAGLTAGSYTVTIKDANGCQNNTTISVPNQLAPTLTLTSTPATCLQSNGTITITGAGGSAPYQYSSNGTVWQVSNILTGLTGGTQSAYIKDNAGCIASKSILITAPNVPQTLSATITSASCGSSNGSLVAAATGGITPYQYSINGTTYQASATFSLLPGGTYPLTVKDANQCTKTINVVVANLAGPTVSTTSTLSSCFANDGTITALASGGTGALQYSKNGIIFQPSPVFTLLAPGAYTITVKDTKNCLATSTITVGKVAGPLINVTTSPSGCGDTIIVSYLGGTPGYQYNINNDPYQLSPLFPCKLAGSYVVRVEDGNGCKDSTVVTILGSPLPVALLAFQGQTFNQYNQLFWTTASELNNDYFTLERSADGRSFTALGDIDGSGNSTDVRNYSFKDYTPAAGLNYYRLKQTDFDGTSSLSKIIALRNDQISGISYSYNAVDQQVYIHSSVSHTAATSVNLTDELGRIVYQGEMNGQDAMLNVSTLAQGTYFLQVAGEAQNLKAKILLY